MGSSSGRLFKITTFGESHGPAVGVIIEGCPSGWTLDLEQLQVDLNRRRPGQSALTTARKEQDRVEVLSGLFENQVTGTPLTLMVWNKDAKSRDYSHVQHLYRPGHGDLTYQARYGVRDWRGGGRASARETVARVAAGAVARQWLAQKYGIEVLGWVEQVGSLSAQIDPETVSLEQVEHSSVRCPNLQKAVEMETLIKKVKKQGDTLGGVVGAVARGVPLGWGDPVFDKLEADLAKACLSLPACKGFEIGSGFEGTKLRGSEHNDAWFLDQGQPSLKTNHCGGILGGISTGTPLLVRCAFKPVSTHFQSQTTLDYQYEQVEFKNRGRHDPCVVPRAVPLVEAAILLTLADHALRTEALWSGQIQTPSDPIE